MDGSRIQFKQTLPLHTVRHGLDNVAQAVREFAVLYERVEAQKAQALMDREEKRQNFERELEAMRMQVRLQTQAQGYQD